MGFIRTYVANSNELFSDEELDLIKGAGQKVESYVNQHFDFDYNVDLIVTTPSLTFPVIPEDGVGGKTCSSRLIVLAIDREAFDFNEAFLLETMAHEMAHSLRWEKVSEYAETLIDGAILEGLAIVLEEKVLADLGVIKKQFFLEEVQKSYPEQAKEILSVLSGDLNATIYDYNTIFYTGNKVLPRWAGYKLGYYLVRKYLERSGRSALEATFDSYKDIANSQFN